MSEFESVSVIGLGYIGLPTAAMFADSGLAVIGVDVNSKAVETINSGRAHIEEGDLDALVERCVRSGKLQARLTPMEADAFIIAVPTPVSHDDDHRPDLDYIRAAGRAIAPVLAAGNLVILESTSPVGTTEMLASLLAHERPDLCTGGDGPHGLDIHLAYCPERIIPGKMLVELVENDRVIGGLTEEAAEQAARLYRSFVKGACHITTARVAEMVKLAENSFRDVNIAFANELSMIAEKQDADVWEVIRLANRHPRVSILSPGAGVGGHCIAVDPWFLVHGSPNESRLIRTAREVNDAKPQHVVKLVEAVLEADPDARVACLGLTYKADVDDFRESPALQIAEALSKKFPGRVLAVDPYGDALDESVRARSALALVPLDQALQEAGIILPLVAHAEFKVMERPDSVVVIDPVGLWK